MSGRSSRSTRSNHHMGQKKKVHSLPPLEGKRRDSKQSLRTQSLGLGVGMPDRQRIIGSPAPQAYRQQIEKNRNKKGSNGPTITLSAAEDEDEDDDDEDFLIQRDSVLEVGQVGCGKKSRINSSLSLYSVASLGSAVEQSRASSGRRSGLSPPPRVISMMDAQGNHVTTEWNVPGMESIEN
ncbi:uncharacterized protein LOC111712995, partial [Eurytemora carolleeae]|uniref:uncharacterized protein LOC111712995 n=1 Tax=Eurytemora carolleeae TaxID=1294199 RepID=UPI000C762AF0